METTDIKIRRLKRKDRVTVTRMIAKLADKLGDTEVTNIIHRKDGAQSESADSQAAAANGYTRIGIQIIRSLIENLEEDISAWFADLCGIKVEELDELPLDAEIHIIEAIKNAPEANSFFSGASRLFSGIDGLSGGSQTGSDPSAPATD